MARGSIRKRSPRSYEIRWDVPVGEDGKRRVRQKTVQGNKKTAEAELNRILADLNKSDAERASEMPVQECYRRFLKERSGNDLRPGTVKGYNSFFKNYVLPECGEVPLARVDRENLQRVIQRMIDAHLAPYTIQVNYQCLKGFFSWTVKAHLLTKTPATGLTLPEVIRTSTAKILSAEGVRKVLDLLEGTPYWLPAFLGLYTGMRPGEVLGLSWEDVDLLNGKVFVKRTLNPAGEPFSLGPPKNESSERSIAVSQKVVRVLRDRRQKMPENFWHGTVETVGNRLKCVAVPVEFPQVCAQPDGRIVKAKAWGDAFRSKLPGAGLKAIRLHDLRHTHASLLLLDGMPMLVVSRRLGHATIQRTINQYGHLLPSSDLEAASGFEGIIDDEA